MGPDYPICVIARSDEAKAIGVEMGAPWHLVRSRFTGVAVRSSNYALYGDMGARVVEVLRRFAPRLEIYSIDEAFLGLDGFDARLEAHARALRDAVLRWTGIPVSVGIAPTKTLAKAANRFAKRDPGRGGVLLLLDEAAQDAALARMDLTHLWGVAGRTAARLRAAGIASPSALKRADPRFVRERFTVVLERTARELRGTPCIALDEATPDRKTVMASRSFGRPVTARAEMEEAVATYATRAAEKLRRQRLATPCMVVFVETNTFRPEEPQHCASRTVHLPVATSDTGRIIRAALAGLAVLFRPGFSYKKAGVLLLDLHPAAAAQPGLFDAPDGARSRALMRAVDGLNARFGRDAVAFAAAGRRRAWRLRSDHLSPRYTTRWSDLLRVR